MNKTSPITSIMTCGVMLLSATPAAAGEMFFDEARVLDSQPVYETRQTPVQVQDCGYQDAAAPGRADPTVLGDARSPDRAAGLVDALHTDQDLRAPPQPVYRCRMVTQTAERRELSGYRVRFRYEGRIYERHMAEDPGERIRVRVRVSAGEQHLLTRSTGEPTFTTRSAAW